MIENVSALESVPENSFEGVVSKVTDGDTLNIRTANGETIPIRLTLVDAPETNEQGYNAAKDFVTENCLGKQAIVDPDNRQDLSFGRLVAVVYCDGFNINEAVIANGFATLYTSFCSVSEFANTDWAQRFGCDNDNDSSTSSSGSSNNNNGDDEELRIDIGIGQNPIQRGKTQQITVTVTASDSNDPISGANVDGKVRYASGSTDNKGAFSKVTGTDGQVIHSWQIGGNAREGTFTVLVDASADGYGSSSETKSFQVISLSDAIGHQNVTQEHPISNGTSNNTVLLFDNPGSNSGDIGGTVNETSNNDDELIPIYPSDQILENGICVDSLNTLFVDEIEDPVVCTAADPSCEDLTLQEQEEFSVESADETTLSEDGIEGELEDKSQQEEISEDTAQSDDSNDEQDTDDSTNDEETIEESNNENDSDDSSSEQEAS